MLFDAGKKPAFAELSWKGRRRRLRRRRLKIVVAAVAIAAMIGDEQFAVAVDCETRDVERGVGEQLVPGDLGAIVANAPNAAGGVIAIDVRAVELGQLAAVIDVAAGHRAAFA